MPEVRVPILVQDPETWQVSPDGEKLPLYECVDISGSSFQDGPSTDIVVSVQDKQNMAKYIPPKKNQVHGGYLGPSGENIIKNLNDAKNSPDCLLKIIKSEEFIQISTFACILRTIGLFKSEILGREWNWSFKENKEKALMYQPFCRPEQSDKKPDGEYQRKSGIISFNVTQQTNGKELYASLSREIVAHETAHAVIDGINPNLLKNEWNWNALALHEALADLTALFVTIGSHHLMDYVMGLEKSVGEITNENAFNQFAENIGKAYGKKKALRVFREKMDLEQANRKKDYHDTSIVLSGAVWDVFEELHGPCRDVLTHAKKYKDKIDNKYSASGEPLARLSVRLQLIIYRALDLLPGGDITLSDFGRAVLLADWIIFGPDTGIAKSLTNAFIKRKIFRTESEAVAGNPPAENPKPPSGGWSAFLKNARPCRREARKYVYKEREKLGIPKDAEIIGIENIPCIKAPAKNYIDVKRKIPRSVSCAPNMVAFHKKPGVRTVRNVASPPENAEKISIRNIHTSHPGSIGVLRITWRVYKNIIDRIFVSILKIVAPQKVKTGGTSIIIDLPGNCILGMLSTMDAP